MDLGKVPPCVGPIGGHYRPVKIRHVVLARACAPYGVLPFLRPLTASGAGMAPPYVEDTAAEGEPNSEPK